MSRDNALGMRGLVVIEDLKSGNHRQALTALRDILADQIVLCEPSVVAQVAARLQAVLTELAALPAESKQTTVDQLRARRDQRRGA